MTNLVLIPCAAALLAAAWLCWQARSRSATGVRAVQFACLLGLSASVYMVVTGSRPILSPRTVVVVDRRNDPDTVQWTKQQCEQLAAKSFGEVPAIYIDPALQTGMQDETVAPTAQEAISRALKKFESRATWEKVLDTIVCRRQRIVVFKTDPKLWSEQILSVPEALQSLERQGVRLDVITSERGDPVPTLEIVVNAAALGPHIERLPVQLKFGCSKLAGHRTSQVYTELEVRIDGHLMKLKRGQDVKERKVDADGCIVVSSFKSLFEGGDLRSGIHFLECIMAVTIDGQRYVGKNSCYLPIRFSNVLFIAGKGNRISSGRKSDELASIWRNVNDTSLPDNVLCEDFLDEDQRLDGLLSGEPPLLVVAHDWSDVAWRTHGPILDRWLEQGTHLLICGLPPKDCVQKLPENLRGMFPAYATGPQDAETWHVQRKPRVVFVVDSSRLSLLQYPPTELTSQLPPMVGESGFELQGKIIQQICGAINVSYDPDKQLFGQPGEGGLEAAVLQYESPKEQGKLVGCGSILRRLETLLPPDVRRGLQLDPNSLPHEWRTTSAVEGGEAGRAAQRELKQIGLGDVVVVFSYEGILQAEDGKGALAALLARGASVVNIRMSTDISKAYAEGINAPSPSPEMPKLTKAIDELLREEEGADLTNNRIAPRAAKGRLIQIQVNSQDRGEKSREVADAIRNVTAQKSVRFAGNRWGRFIDERIGPANDESRDWEGPFEIQDLSPSEKRGWQTYASVVGNYRAPIAIGGPVKNGLVLALGYSPFEPRIFPPGMDTPWGAQRIIDFSSFCADLDRPNGPSLQLQSVEKMNARGGLRFEFHWNRTIDAALPQFTIGNPEHSMSPTSFDSLTGAVAVEMDHSQVATVLQNSGDIAGQMVRLRMGDTVQDIYLPKPPDSEAFTFLDGGRELAALARYSSGGDVGKVEDLPAMHLNRTAPPILVLLSLASVWLIRFIRKYVHTWRQAAKLQREASRSPVELFRAGVTSEIGLLEGRPTTNCRAGDLAGWRPFEPGDSLRSAVREDLLQMALPGPARRLIPRIVQRIEPRSGELVIVVHVGASMQFPRTRRPASTNIAGGCRSPKLAVAASVVELLAEYGWSKHATVTIVTTGEFRARTFGPDPVPHEKGDITRWLLDVPSSRLDWRSKPHLPTLDESSGALIYVSDFLGESLDELQDHASELQTQGWSLGAVQVFSPAEFEAIDVGFSPADRKWVDRTEWLPEDVERVYDHFGRRLVDRWSGTDGGLLRISSAYELRQILEVLGEGRLLSIIR